MKNRKSIKFAALLLAASICASDFSGAGTVAFAKTRDVTEGNAQEKENRKEEDGILQTQGEEALQAAEEGQEAASLAEEAFAELLNDYEMYGMLANDVVFPVYQEASWSLEL